MRAREQVVALIVVASFVPAGCASMNAYEPRPSHRIAHIGANEHSFVRDGQRFDLGLFGDAEPLVRGDAIAEVHARRYHRNEIGGLTLYGVGLGLGGTGVGLLVSERTGTRQVVGTALFTSSLLVMLASIPFLVAARTNLIDAVNIYNDGLESSAIP